MKIIMICMNAQVCLEDSAHYLCSLIFQASPQIFHVSVTSNDKAAKEVTFICEFTVDTVYDDMYEEDIYNILRIGIGKDGFSTTEMSTKRMPNVRATVTLTLYLNHLATVSIVQDLLEIYYDYLKEHGITQEFLSFLRNNFLPSYLHYCFVEQFLKPMKNLTKQNYKYLYVYTSLLMAIMYTS